MSAVEDYVARIEETCGEEKGAVVTFKYVKKDEAFAKIMKRATLQNSLSGIIFACSQAGKLSLKVLKAKKRCTIF